MKYNLIMSTPVLTKQQQKHSLSAKKAPNKGLRNVLAQPQDSYWPIVSADKCKVLEDLLKKLMPVIKRPSHSIPWSQLRHMKKEERAQAKKEAISKVENVPDPKIGNSVVLGINAITRALEKNDICCVLMDASIEPPLLIRHIIQMAQNNKIPLLLLPELKTITLNTIGFASAACAPKNIVKESQDHYFYPLHQMIHDIFKDVSLPKKTFKLFEQLSCSEESESYETDDMSTEPESQLEPSESNKFTLSTDVYMYRSSRNERAFVPPTAIETPTSESVTKAIDSNDFIAVSGNDDEYTHVKKHSRYINIRKDKNWKQRKQQTKVNDGENVTYFPLKVKRIQGNPNRVKATKVSKQKKKS
ncbi:uncharacterized protein LOC114876588 [Osmia bicornis bicornis]|uniref:uncharacterized protein LOC114876588 n=1 Tax=Osmia bicornis bicornis TaxID=1437191 RepID=UPI001EAEA9B9|nr:uncharacterized protein LOC114876588 [Osmia bicornis bicornis]XP_029044092.2 uncharacterized protein LOC114876588 [Osmia bicornis bicornis]